MHICIAWYSNSLHCKMCVWMIVPQWWGGNEILTWFWRFGYNACIVNYSDIRIHYVRIRICIHNRPCNPTGQITACHCSRIPLRLSNTTQCATRPRGSTWPGPPLQNQTQHLTGTRSISHSTHRTLRATSSNSSIILGAMRSDQQGVTA